MKLCWYFRSVQALLTIIKKAPKVTLFFTRRYSQRYSQRYGIGNGWPEKFHINATSRPHGLHMMLLSFQLEIQYYRISEVLERVNTLGAYITFHQVNGGIISSDYEGKCCQVMYKQHTGANGMWKHAAAFASSQLESGDWSLFGDLWYQTLLAPRNTVCKVIKKTKNS